MKGTAGRGRLTILAALLLFVAGGSLVLVPPLAARRTTGGISLFVSCVLKQQNRTYDAMFGYTNSTGAEQTIPLGAANRLSAPAPSGRKPPTVFAPGTDEKALFISNIPNGTTFSWTVTYGGVTSIAVATSTGTRCSSSSQPGTPPGTTTSTTPTEKAPKSPPAGPVDVGLVKTVSPARVREGQLARYTLRVTNHGPRAAAGVRIVDRLPAGLVLVHATVEHGTCTQARLVVCTVASLGVGKSVAAHILTRVDSTRSLTNVGFVTALQPETTMRNNTSRVVLHVAAPKRPVAPATATVHAKPRFTG
jgi:uncharacterized repeat protein (TIGR01451 family)